MVDPAVATVAIRVSAVTGKGIEDLKAALVRHADVGDDRGVTILRERQRIVLEAAAHAVERAVDAFATSRPPDVIAVDIMTALDHLGQIVGATSVEAVLDRIFSEFCIGK